MKKLSLAICITFLLALACKDEGKSQGEESIMYESTPLALLMLDMHATSEDWKEMIKADSFNVEIPQDFYGIYTVEATDSNVRTEVFMSQADVYLKSVKELVETKKQKKQVKKFNTSIDACIACHQVFCQGPIDKIKKLYIED